VCACVLKLTCRWLCVFCLVSFSVPCFPYYLTHSVSDCRAKYPPASHLPLTLSCIRRIVQRRGKLLGCCIQQSFSSNGTLLCNDDINDPKVQAPSFPEDLESRRPFSLWRLEPRVGDDGVWCYVVFHNGRLPGECGVRSANFLLALLASLPPSRLTCSNIFISLPLPQHCKHSPSPLAAFSTFFPCCCQAREHGCCCCSLLLVAAQWLSRDGMSERYGCLCRTTDGSRQQHPLRGRTYGDAVHRVLRALS